MNRDFITGLLLGILLTLFIMWLLDSDPTPDDDTRARQGVPQKYAENISSLEGVG